MSFLYKKCCLLWTNATSRIRELFRVRSRILLVWSRCPRILYRIPLANVFPTEKTKCSEANGLVRCTRKDNKLARSTISRTPFDSWKRMGNLEKNLTQRRSLLAKTSDEKMWCTCNFFEPLSLLISFLPLPRKSCAVFSFESHEYFSALLPRYLIQDVHAIGPFPWHDSVGRSLFRNSKKVSHKSIPFGISATSIMNSVKKSRAFIEIVRAVEWCSRSFQGKAKNVGRVMIMTCDDVFDLDMWEWWW